MQLTPEQVKGRIKNIAKVNNADARILMRLYMILLTIYEKEIDADILKSAFNATCKKRSTENLKEEAPNIMSAVNKDVQLHKLWNSYQKKYPYAADISYEDVMDSIKLLWSKLL